MPEGSACETSNLNPAQAHAAEGRCDGEGSPENRAPAAVRVSSPSTRELSVALSAASGWKGGFRHPDGVITRDLDVDASRSGRAADLQVIPQRGKRRRFRKGRRFPILIAVEPLRFGSKA